MPTLVAAHTYARESMPGMMDTILNSACEKSVEAMVKATGNPASQDCYRRFVRCTASVVLGVQEPG
ncbi:MAG: hypothetical protein ACLT8E_10490 [Akkermansia sp.]